MNKEGGMIMGQLAIKGHATRGKEVIELLEMLGGENKYHINITEENLLYTIREGDNAIIATYPNSSISKIFSIEEFIEKFPYKVGDKVRINDCNDYDVYIISDMYWENDSVVYSVRDIDGCLHANQWLVGQLESYKEEKSFGEYVEEKMKESEMLLGWVSESKGKRLIPHKDYEIKQCGKEFYLVKRKYHYPKTYEECCELLGIPTLTVHFDIDYSNTDILFENLYRLIICRDAFWKIAGERMGSGKQWEPDFTCDLSKHYISFNNDKIDVGIISFMSKTLVFPTAEMRDVFLENFKDEIKRCKELL